MKNLNNRQFSKKIVIAILIVMSFNFLSPNILSVNANTWGDENFGGKLFRPIAQLLCAVADVIISKLQETFIGTNVIEYDGTPRMRCTGICDKVFTRNYIFW